MADVAPAQAGQLSADGRWRWDGAAWQPVAAAQLPAWADARVRWTATPAVLGIALLVGVISDQALRTGTFGLAASLTFVGLSVATVTMGRLQRVESRLLVAAAVLFAMWFTLRASPWLLWPDLVAVLILLGLATSFAVRGSIVDTGISELLARFLHAVIQLAAGAAFGLRPALRARGRLGKAAPVLRGALIALPIAALLGGLLASADPVFASFFKLDVDVGQLVLDVLFIAAGTWSAAGLLRIAASEPLDRIDGPAWRLGATETLVVLAVLDIVFLGFAAAQVLAATGAAAGSLRSAGVTYAAYARSGFFQLLWVAGITLAVLVLFSRIGNLAAHNSRRAFTVMALVAIALTLMIDVVAFRRLSLYEEAYGFTMLRLYSHVFAVWLGFVFVQLAADFLGLWRRRRWFVGATLVTALAVLFALDVLSPEAIVVSLNTNHAQTAHKIDSQYFTELSADATPALLGARSQLEPMLRDQVTTAACAGNRAYRASWAAFNLAEMQAVEARRTSC